MTLLLCCQANHLVGLKRTYLKLSFLSVEDLTKFKREIMPAIKKNNERDKSHDAYLSMLVPTTSVESSAPSGKRISDQLENVIDLR